MSKTYGRATALGDPYGWLATPCNSTHRVFAADGCTFIDLARSRLPRRSTQQNSWRAAALSPTPNRRCRCDTLKALRFQIVIPREYERAAPKFSIEYLARKQAHSRRSFSECLAESLDVQPEIVGHAHLERRK